MRFIFSFFVKSNVYFYTYSFHIILKKLAIKWLKNKKGKDMMKMQIYMQKYTKELFHEYLPL